MYARREAAWDRSLREVGEGPRSLVVVERDEVNRTERTEGKSW